MELIPVSLESLSSLTYSVFLPAHNQFEQPEFIYVKFSGQYRRGAEGASDATFIVAAMEAVKRAWYTTSVIIDLTELIYEWGDEIAWVYGVGWDSQTQRPKSLAIIVSDNCREALQTLSPDEYDEYCVSSLDLLHEGHSRG